MVTHCQKIWRQVLELDSIIPELRAADESLKLSISSSISNRVILFATFAQIATRIRLKFAGLPEEWNGEFTLKRTSPLTYCPRWTLSMFYIQGNLARCLRDLVGLDVGALSGCPPLENISLCTGLSKEDYRLEDLKQPHFSYYTKQGVHMKAVDIRAPLRDYPEIGYGDVRSLDFKNDTFDFLTIPMVLGTGNPCDTYLEVAMATCEMWRVLKPGGFVYIADSSFSPVISLTAQKIGFTVYCSKGSDRGLPIGTFLHRPPKQGVKDSWFIDSFVSEGLFQITLPSKAAIRVKNCNLLLDNNFPVWELLTK
jgi:SAM-dependent methyltransferase